MIQKQKFNHIYIALNSFTLLGVAQVQSRVSVQKFNDFNIFLGQGVKRRYSSKNSTNLSKSLKMIIQSIKVYYNMLKILSFPCFHNLCKKLNL